MSDKVYIGPNKVGHFEKGEPYAPVSRVTMWYDDEHCFTAGDDSGRVMEMDNPWATQEIVNNVYNQLKGFVYQPFEATGVSWDPSIELGDAVNIGGIYSMIGRREIRMGKEYIANISCPGEKEIDHDFPHYSKTERELKRRVKLGQKYQGVQIDRRDGLTITEMLEDGAAGAKVVLNSKELTFYDVGGGKVLYFDPVSKTYKFMGELNVNDKFVVDKKGDVTVKGNLLLSEESTITWGTKGPVKYKFATALTGPWHDIMEANDKYRRDSLDGGTTWGDPYQFKGTDGQNGANGSDATVPKYITETVISKGVIEAPQINANNFAIFPNNPGSTTGSFKICGMFRGGQYEMFSILYQDVGSTPQITFKGAPIYFDYHTPVNFEGPVNFTGGVTGATFTLA